MQWALTSIVGLRCNGQYGNGNSSFSSQRTVSAAVYGMCSLGLLDVVLDSNDDGELAGALRLQGCSFLISALRLADWVSVIRTKHAARRDRSAGPISVRCFFTQRCADTTCHCGLKTAILVRLGRVQMACKVLRLGEDLQGQLVPATSSAIIANTNFEHHTPTSCAILFHPMPRPIFSARTAVLIGRGNDSKAYGSFMR